MKMWLVLDRILLLSFYKYCLNPMKRNKNIKTFLNPWTKRQRHFLFASRLLVLVLIEKSIKNV